MELFSVSEVFQVLQVTMVQQMPELLPVYKGKGSGLFPVLFNGSTQQRPIGVKMQRTVQSFGRLSTPNAMAFLSLYGHND